MRLVISTVSGTWEVHRRWDPEGTGGSSISMENFKTCGMRQKTRQREGTEMTLRTKARVTRRVMSTYRNRRVWEGASFGGEIDDFDFRCVAFGEMAGYASGNFQ